MHVGKEFNKHKIDADNEAALGENDGMESAIDEDHVPTLYSIRNCTHIFYITN